MKDTMDLKMLRNAFVAALFSVGLAACGGEREEAEPVDPFAEEVDEMTDEAQDAWDDAVEEAEEAAEEAQEAWDDAMDEMEDY